MNRSTRASGTRAAPPSRDRFLARSGMWWLAAARPSNRPRSARLRLPRPVLHLTNGGFVPGELVPSSEPDVLRWQADAFVAPFDFALGAVNAVHFPDSRRSFPEPTGDYCFELAGGDVLFGSLVALDDTQSRDRRAATGTASRRSDRASTGCTAGKSSGDLIYLGPNGLAGWRDVSAKRGGGKSRDSPGPIRREPRFAATSSSPPGRRSSSRSPGRTSPTSSSRWASATTRRRISRAFRFEVWERDLIIQRETEQEADVASVGEIAPGPGRVHLIAYLDQEKGRILVFSVDGKPLADLKVAGGQAPGAGRHFSGRTSGVTCGWSGCGSAAGTASRRVRSRPERSRIHRVDGSITYGQVKRFDAGLQNIRDRHGQGGIADPGRSDRRRLPLASRRRQWPGPRCRLPGRLATERHPGPCGKDGLAVDRPGDRRTAELAPGRAAFARLAAAARRRPRRSADCRASSSWTEFACPAAWWMAASSPGRAAWSGSRREAARRARSVPECPVGSSTGSPLRVARHATPGACSLHRRGRAASSSGFLSALGRHPARASSSGKRKSLYLRSGDVIPSEVTSIDEKGVHFRTSLSASTFVAHDKVKAVELAHPGDVTVRITKPKRERLLMLPRMQKENPPTHLIRSRNGDFLRGRLIKMDDKTLQVEMRLETEGDSARPAGPDHLAASRGDRPVDEKRPHRRKPAAVDARAGGLQ